MKKKLLDTQTAASADSKPAACTKKKVSISVKRLREIAPPRHLECSAVTKDDRAYIPPALVANKPEPQKLTTETSEDKTEGDLSKHFARGSEQLPSPAKDGQASQTTPEAYCHESVVHDPSEVKEEAAKQKAADIFVSQYDAGQKEAVRAVFKQRIQNAPVFKEVKVQLLDNTWPDKKDNPKSTHSEMDSATTVAAATAAAIASTAPLLKVQSDLEAKVNSVSEILKKLQETDRQLQRAAEQQATVKAQQSDRSPCHQRVGELEKQMNLFMEQRIHHLENLQQQQMNIQSHLISSALNSGGFQVASTAPSKETTKNPAKPGRSLATQTSTQQDLFSASAVHTQACSRHFGNHDVHRQKSPLNTPAPRHYAPVPVSRDAKISQKLSKREQSVGEKENLHQSAYGRTLGGGKLLEQILNSQETPLRRDASSLKEPMQSNAVLWPFERECRSSVQQPEPFHAFKSTNHNFNPVERTVKKADDVLRDLGQLKREMHDILQDAKDWKSDMNRIMKTTPHLREAVQVKDHLPQPQSSLSVWPSSEAPIPMPPPAEKDPVAPTLLELQQLSKSSILQSTKASKSILRDAEKILRAVQKNKKLLEENLEAIIRAKDGNALHAFIDELTADRDVLEEIRIRKTVDEWIKTISMEIQDEMGRTDCLKRQQATKMTKASREINGKSQYPPRIPTKRPLPATRPIQKLTDKGLLKTKMGLQNEEFLSQVYGKPIYQGHRSTLKKSPYLRFNSPPPKSKPPRPKLIESVKGTKVKSARTQTSHSMHSKVASSEKPHLASAPHQELQYLFSPSKEAPSTSGPLEGHLIPMAIPLGQKQINGISPQPAGICIGEFHPVTVTTSVPPPPPNLQKPQVNVKKPNIAVIHMKSEKKDPPKLTLQVLPNVDIDSILSDNSSVNQVSLTSFPAKGMIQASPDGSLLQDEELKLPGAHFDVTDVSQDEGDEDAGIPEFVEPVLEFNRRGERESPKYNGPPFPPAPPPQVSSDVLDEIIEKRETLESKLVDWVEQEVMARIINGMYPTQKEAVPNINSSESEHSLTVSSDIVEAAGTAGFRLFVDAGIPVDSEMIRQFVNEALAETVATMLGDRETHKAAPVTVVPPTVTLLPEKETVLSTPLVTPEATPPQSPSPPLKEPSPVKTPESSPSVTEMDGNVGGQPLRTGAGPEAAVASLLYTPVVTPVATPPKVVTPSPPVSEHVPDMEAMGKPGPPNPWEDAELPLEEEKPSPQSEEGAYHPRAVIMSVAKHEEPDSLVLPASVLTEPHDLQSQEPRAPSPSVHTPSSGSSTEESSVTTTETETVDRPISEGEVLCSYGQLIVAKALAEGGLSLPNLSDSLTSSLHDAQEMDYDPPSEGQVLRRPHKGYHRDLVLSLFSKLNQAPLASQEEICGSEYTDDSAGELSEGQRPRLTRAAESILMGRSVYMERSASQAPRQPKSHKPSPGQHGGEGGEVLEDVDVTHGPMSMAELDQPVSPTAYGDSRLASPLDSTSLKRQETLQPVKSRVISVKPRSDSTQQQDFPGDTNYAQLEPSGYFASLLPVAKTAPHLSNLPEPAKMSVMVPSVNIDDELQSFSSIHGSSDSSGADTL